MKKCPRCKAEAEFFKSQTCCKSCSYKRNQKYSWYYKLKKEYGISLAQYQDLYTAQEGRCAICKLDFLQLLKRPCVDHDHETGKIRGLLCPSCNSGIGYFKDSYQNLTSAIHYLFGQATE